MKRKNITTKNLKRERYDEIVKALRKENSKYTRDLERVSIDRTKFPGDNLPIDVWRSRDFFVQVYNENGKLRITVNRAMINRRGEWLDNITWDELYWIKNQLGFANKIAVEVFPKVKDLVDVSNMRHLWIIDEEDFKYYWGREK